MTTQSSLTSTTARGTNIVNCIPVCSVNTLHLPRTILDLLIDTHLLSFYPTPLCDIRLFTFWPVNRLASPSGLDRQLNPTSPTPTPLSLSPAPHLSRQYRSAGPAAFSQRHTIHNHQRFPPYPSIFISIYTYYTPTTTCHSAAVRKWCSASSSS